MAPTRIPSDPRRSLGEWINDPPPVAHRDRMQWTPLTIRWSEEGRLLPPTYTENPHLRCLAKPPLHQGPSGPSKAEKAELELWGSGTGGEASEGARAPISGCIPEPPAKGGDLKDVLKGLASSRRQAAKAPAPTAPAPLEAPKASSGSEDGVLVAAQDGRFAGRLNFTPQGRPTAPEEKRAFVLGNKCAMTGVEKPNVKQVWDTELKQWRFLGEEEEPVQPVVVAAEGRTPFQVTEGVFKGDAASVEKRLVPTRFLAEKTVTVLELMGGKGAGVECGSHPHGTT